MTRDGQRSALDGDIANADFLLSDMGRGLPFGAGSFDGIVCIDSVNHFRDRLAVFREWYRVLKPGQRIVFTDPVVLTGPVTNEEIAERSNIEVLRTDTPLFTKYVESRRNRRDAWYLVPAGHTDVCSISIPVRDIAGPQRP